MALTVKVIPGLDGVRCRKFFVRGVSLLLVRSREMRYRAFLIILVGLSFLLPANAPAQGQSAQVADRITGSVDSSRLQELPNHVPSWANRANDVGPVPDGTPLSTFTLVLERSPDQEQAFDQLLKDQQDSASPEYHHWLTPIEMGNRFGLSQHDIETIQGWLASQGLQVNWVSPSRIFISFGGTAADIMRAFHTQLHLYKVGGEKRISVASAPKIPQALALAIKAVHGLHTVTVRPAHHAISRELSPDSTDGNGNHLIAPGDFATIYDLPSNLNINRPAGQSTYDGSGVTIGIVGLSHTDFTDFDNFRQMTQSTFPNPVEYVPTAYGGVPPPPAQTTQGESFNGDQFEATLDVTRAGSVAPGANLLLVVSSSPTTNGLDGVVAGDWGIQADIAYLVNTTPLPAQVMSISFGGCESGNGSAVDTYDALFSQAAGEGISVFVSAGDSGAAVCDAPFTLAPDIPQANSPNFLCSSSHVTCVGGTEFNDAIDPSLYWSSGNNSDLSSALSYIPEGGWNESSTSSSAPCQNSSGQPASGPCVAAGSGGVSSIIPTPPWQKDVTGVPTAYTGRYTPDIAFSSSGHDAYLICFAEDGAPCVSSGGGWSEFTGAAGTSAAAPSMAGIAAVLDQKTGGSQGNLSPGIYAMYESSPSAFHDVTVATSGVTSCSVDILSMCNNSTPTGLGGVQAGYLVGSGYDEVTGLGSLDVSNFINDFAAAPLPTVSSLSISPTTITSGGSAMLTITLSAAPTEVAAVTLTSSNESVFAVLSPYGITPGQASASFTIQTGTVTSPTSVTVTASYNGSSQQATITINPANAAPGFTLSASPATLSIAQSGHGTSTITLTDVGGFSGNASLSMSGLPSGVTGSFANGSVAGTQVLTLTASTSAAVTSTSVMITITGTSGTLTASTTIALNINAEPSFTSGNGGTSSITIGPGATTGNSGTISVVGTNGFAGTVNLSCAITTSLTNVNDMPTCGLNPNSVAISGTAAQASALTVTTTAASGAENQMKKLFGPLTGGMTLAWVVIFAVPRRQRHWLTMWALLLLSVFVGTIGCAGGSSGGGEGGGNSGTTAGIYTITVTGTSGTTSATVGAITLTVQ